METSREKNIMGSEFSVPDEASYSLQLVRVKPISCQGGLLQDFPGRLGRGELLLMESSVSFRCIPLASL